MHYFYVEGKQKQTWWKKYDPYSVNVLEVSTGEVLIFIRVREKESGVIITSDSVIAKDRTKVEYLSECLIDEISKRLSRREYFKESLKIFTNETMMETDY